MPDSAAPMDLLRKYRKHFAHQAEQCREREKSAPIRGQEAAASEARAYETFVREIDATLRDWA